MPPPGAPPLAALAPFVALLGLIAAAPVVAPRWWHRSYPGAAFGLGAITVAYYLLGRGEGVAVLHAAHEYISFVCLVGSLFIVSGGVWLDLRVRGGPLANGAVLAVGAALANVVGTTGASMLLIRPWLRMNEGRLAPRHVAFFIMIVSNVGGCLTPVGDPPLFLGYLKGIPFWWVAEHCWPMWLTAVASLLAVFAVWDSLAEQGGPAAAPSTVAGQTGRRWIQCRGGYNLALAVAIVAGVLWLQKPWSREAAMIAAAGISWLATPASIRRANDFSFEPIREVAVLFAGLFATMMPALDLLAARASALGRPSAGFFFAGTGVLSSILDNAPTYLSFLTAATAGYVDPAAVSQVGAWFAAGGPPDDAAAAAPGALAAFEALTRQWSAVRPPQREQIEAALLLSNAALNPLIVAISVGAVFFGANTYIGNGPNLMVKSIAERCGAPTPSFFSYIGRFAAPVMGPMLVLVWLLFFH